MNDKYTNDELAECVEEVRKQVPKGFIAYPMLAEAARRLRAAAPQPPEPGRLSGELMDVLKLVYRKHVCSDDTIGWDELTDKVCDALSNAMGSKEFADWQQEAQR